MLTAGLAVWLLLCEEYLGAALLVIFAAMGAPEWAQLMWFFLVSAIE